MATLFKRSNGIYYYVTTQNGRQIWRSTGSKSLQDALKNIPKDLTEYRESTPTISEFSKKFFTYAQTNLAPTTVKLYDQAVRTWLRHMGDRPLGNYSIQEIEEFKVKRLAEVSAVKVNIDFRTLRAFFQTAVRWKIVKENPFSGVRQIRVPTERPIYISKAEFQKLLAAITFGWFRELVIFATCTMMRAGEILSLQWNSIDLGRKLIFVENRKDFRTKTTKPRVIPMNDWVFRFLATRERKGGFVFTNPKGERLKVGYVSHRFKKFVLKSGLSNELHFHSLRHTGATWLVQDGVSIYAVQKILGHSSIAMTQVYSHLESEGLFEIVAKIIPPAGEIEPTHVSLQTHKIT